MKFKEGEKVLILDYIPDRATVGLSPNQQKRSGYSIIGRIEELRTDPSEYYVVGYEVYNCTEVGGNPLFMYYENNN